LYLSSRDEKVDILQTQRLALQNCLDKKHQGYYHKCSEDWSAVLDSNKHVIDQFIVGRTYIFGATSSGEYKLVETGERLINMAIDKFEDKKNLGFYSTASEDWAIINREKDTYLMALAAGCVLHLYEYTLNEKYLIKMFDILDLLLTKCQDEVHGGFFDSFNEDWSIKSEQKSLRTQVSVVQALGGGYKDGIDSRYAKKAEFYHQKSNELCNLIIEKMYDKEQGGFFAACNANWTVKDTDKDSAQIAHAITALTFHYNELGPSLFGPRKGSHAESGRPPPSWYSYRGPAPNPEPISAEAYKYGKILADVTTLLVEKAWDSENGGFYERCSKDWKPKDASKSILTQTSILIAINMFYRLSGFPEIREKIAHTVSILESKSYDPRHHGFYEMFNREWEPQGREKNIHVNIEVPGAVNMIQAILKRPPITKYKPKVWIKPSNLIIKDGETARYTVTVQNQAFISDKLKMGGITAPKTWIFPPEVSFELGPHQTKTFTIEVRPPKGLAGKAYPFEVAVYSSGDPATYANAIGTVTVT
jgi:mannose/cellobiose epimerase-like protein (N-acyl-D-glucosamine 2-epimerase family)